MSKLIPERPLYKKERLWVGYPALAIFALLFTARLLDRFTALPVSSLLVKLCLLAVVFLLPMGVFFFLRGQGYTRVLRLRMPRAKEIPLLIPAFFVLFCGCILLSVLCGGIDSLGNSATVYETPPPENWLMGVAGALILAVIPAILEELFFRGIAVAEYERRGSVRAVLMSALLFSLCHFDLRNLPVYLFSGVLLAIVVFATDSLFASMLLHICYNLVSYFGQRYLNALYEITGSMELFLFLFILVFLICAVLLLRSCAKIYRQMEQEHFPDPRRDVPYHVQFYTVLDALADPPVILCIILAVVGFILL